MREVFKTFLLLGCTSFGGPMAHIGYFQRVFVTEKQWLDESRFASLLALCQFLPGPASSQLGFAIGFQRAGYSGAIMAFIGFTLPSFLIMWILATWTLGESAQTFWDGIIRALKLVAVVVVTDALLGMYGKFCQQPLARLICYGSAIVLLLWSSLLAQIFVIVAGAFVGWITMNSHWYRDRKPQSSSHRESPQSIARHIRLRPMLGFLGLLILLPLFSEFSATIATANSFYQAGSWVFGGGHVVLPLLQGLLGSGVSEDQFLTGYAAAQAVPGPMFTLAGFLGASMHNEAMFWGALVATTAIFLPGFLLLSGLQNSWLAITENKALQSTTAGINAAVVGLLATALFTPVFTSSVTGGLDMALVAAGFYLLRYQKIPALALVATFIVIGAIFF